MMKKLVGIESLRKTAHYPSYKIVYEWEDIISQKLNLPIHSYNKWWYKIFRRIESYHQTELFHKICPQRGLRLDFTMDAQTSSKCRNNRNTIPVIIDFWLKDEEIPAFFEAYKHVPLILLTNKEVYDLLKRHNCPIPIEHWPLSYPDQYALNKDAIGEKKYDFCLFGRPNPFFVRLQEEYAKKHPGFTYLTTKGTEKDREYYTNKGEFVCKDSGRASYLAMIRSTKVSCYTTPGIDEAKKVPAPFNQVTPRLFEMLCNGCQVIGHYPDSADTQWYKLWDIVPNVDNYKEFEETLDKMLQTDMDFHKTQNFMSKHYTTSRVDMFLKILKKHNIQI